MDFDFGRKGGRERATDPGPSSLALCRPPVDRPSFEECARVGADL